MSAKKESKKEKGRVSGLGFDVGAILIDTAATGAGAVIPEIVIQKVIPTMSPTVTGIGQVLAGAALVAFVPDTPSVQSLGRGMIAGASIRIATALMPGMFGGAAPVQGIGEGDFREASLTVDADFDDDPVSGLDRETPNPAQGSGPMRS